MRRVSLPLCQIGRGNSTKLEKRMISKRKPEGGARTTERAIPSFVALHFWLTVISRGQQERAPLEAGFLSLGGTEELPPEWWQPSMSAISSEELWPAEFFWIEDSSRIVGEPARTGWVQPMTQAKAAIHKETAVAIPALRVRKVGRISNCIIRFQARKDAPIA